MNYAKKIPKLFFSNFDEVEIKKKNKLYGRICRLALLVWAALILPIGVKFSMFMSGAFESYDNKMHYIDMVLLSKFCFPFFVIIGFAIALILYSSDLYRGKCASAFSWVICVSSLVSTYFICNLLDDSFHQLIAISVSILLSLFLYACTPGIVKRPGIKSTIFSRVALTGMILIAVLMPIYNVNFNIDSGAFIDVVYDLFMKGGG